MAIQMCSNDAPLLAPADAPDFPAAARDGSLPRGPGLWAARLFVGLIVLISAEVFSGASLHMGLWHPWTLIVTYWLYFAHFFFFTTLAVWTGRTSFWSLYLWGVLFGLYESWITKVIWFGYGADGKLVMGSLGPFGYSEISMAVIFHPVMSFMLPLAVACLAFPSLRRLFPDLAWFTGKTAWARIVRGYLIFAFVPIIGMNSGGPVNLLLNLAAMLAALFLLWRGANATAAAEDAARVVVFGRAGFAGLCVYLGLLYGATYFILHPQGLPSAGIQLLTCGFYAVIIAGLVLHRKRRPLEHRVEVAPREIGLVRTGFAAMLVLGMLASLFVGTAVVFVPVVANFILWTPLGFVLTGVALVKGVLPWIGGTP